ncbi:helix-turn-helix domain-containing protein [Natronoglycomyces albus]|nr:helix-turn-helix transcriptional regulator [Natronoglycomyces albus]
MSRPTSFTQWRIASAIRRLRENKGWTVREAAANMGVPKDAINHIENLRVQKPNPMVVRGMAAKLGADEEVALELEAMAKQCRNLDATGWSTSLESVPHWFKPVMSMEAEAASHRAFSLNVIYGLFQSEGYMRAMLSLDPSHPEEKIAENLNLRRNRQRDILGHPDGPPDMTVLLSEECLARVEHEDFFQEQVERLLELDDLPQIGIFILPFSAGLHQSIDDSYTIFGFEEPDMQVIYLESHLIGHFETAKKEVEHFGRMFTGSMVAAVPLGRSRFV